MTCFGWYRSSRACIMRPMPTRGEGWLSEGGPWLLCAAVWTAVALIALLPGWTLDDAFITLRYAGNLSRYGALEWNHGGTPVEGYTGLAQPALMATALRIGLSPLAVAKGVGAVAHLGAGILLYAVGRRLGVRSCLAAAGATLYVVAPIGLVNAISGMETTLFTAWTMLAIWSFVRALEPGSPWRDSVLCIALLLTALVRPEGVMLAVPALVVVGSLRLRTGFGAAMTFGIHVTVWFVLPGAVYMVWRLATYGAWMPNSFHAKVQGPWISAGSAVAMAIFVALYLALPLAVGLTLQGARSRFGLRDLAGVARTAGGVRARYLALVIALFVGGVWTVYLGCHLSMNVAHRFFVPFLPMLLLLAALAWESGCRLLERAGPRRRFVVVVAVIAIAAVQGAVYVQELRQYRGFVADYSQLMRDVHIPATEQIKQVADPLDTMAVIGDAGLIPYVTGLRTVDFGMLNDPYLARSAPSSDEIIEYFFERAPDIVVITSNRWDDLVPPDPRAALLVADWRFAEYEVVGVHGTTVQRFRNYYEFVLVRIGHVEKFRRLMIPTDPPSTE